MVTLLRVTWNVSHCRQALLCVRGPGNRHSRYTTRNASDMTTTKRKQRITKKKYADLPQAHAQQDGTFAPPLGDWHGGLVVPKAVHTTILPITDRSSSDSATFPLDSSPSTSAVEAIRGIHAPGGDPLQENPTTYGNDAMVERDITMVNGPEATSSTKPRRKRKSKATPGTEKLSDAPSIPQPRNRLASEILYNLARFPHCILLTRVGQFYESYFDQAQEVARLLNIKLAQRTWDGRRIWMCGFPLAHIDKYLKLLVQNHKRFVALCEEFPRSPHLGAKGGFDRRVIRIVTPGTLIDESFLNPYENNYLLAIAPPSTHGADEVTYRVGLAWMDVSTGEFFTKSIPLENLRDEVVRIGPREVVIDLKDIPDASHPVRRAILEEGYFISYFSPPDDGIPELPSHVSEDASSTDDILSHLHQPLNADTTLAASEVGAIRLLTAFLRANLLEYMPELTTPSRETAGGRMQIDAHTIKALEIREGLSDGGSTGSLLSVVKRTVTSSGTRLLARWLCSPSASLDEISARQSLVAFFHARPHLREDLTHALSEIEDTTRVVQKLLLGRGQSSDLSSICSTIRTWISIQKRIELEKDMEQQERGHLKDEEWTSVDALLRGMHDLTDIVELVENALNFPIGMESSLPQSSPEMNHAEDNNSDVTPRVQSFTDANWTLRRGFTDRLDKLHATLAKLLERRQQLERQLQSEYEAPSLSLRSSPGQGMHVHISKARRDSAKLKNSALFIPLSASNTTKTFFYKDWSQLGAQIVETTTAIYAAEKEAFEMLRDKVSAYSGDLRRNARILDELDVTIAFANLAVDMNFVRPVVNESTAYHVVNGRHPTVELGLLTAGRVFTANTVTMTPSSQLLIITGPNMAGKSTLLRQIALISVLAQSGSFVPADSAEIGIVDRVFSRIGARDDLFRNRSTFMVEMLEMSEILSRATSRSLVIMDEIGRGTTMDDGLAIAFAAVHHLLTVNRSRALFATHFHELADMLGCSNDHHGQGPFQSVRFLCTDIIETEEGYFSYSHRLRPGVNRDSHGLKVAQLAGMPTTAVSVAGAALSWLKNRRVKASDAHALQTLGQSLVYTKNI